VAGGIGAGSGFIIDKRGYILTNFSRGTGSAIHRSRAGRSIAFIRQKFIGADQRNDVALLKIDPLVKNLSTLAAGRFECAAGRPKSSRHRQSVWISKHADYRVVSALGRRCRPAKPRLSMEAIQTDAAINRGQFPGGPAD